MADGRLVDRGDGEGTEDEVMPRRLSWCVISETTRDMYPVDR